MRPRLPPKVITFDEKEDAVKKEITKYLLTLQTPSSGVQCYFRMPVASPMGKPGLDYEGCVNGIFFAIEAKAPGEWLTPRQRYTTVDILNGGGKVFAVSRAEGLDAFKRWVSSLHTAGSTRHKAT